MDAALLGWESTFKKDLNDDGLISGGDSYQLSSKNGPVTLRNRGGRTLSDSTSRSWDALVAAETASGFDVLLRGDGSLQGRFSVWSTNAVGVITDRSAWKTQLQALEADWEKTFQVALNNDHSI